MQFVFDDLDGDVRDINPGAGSSDPATFAVHDGKLFFRASDGVIGAELWVYG
jgi:hypothetical protein